MSFLIAVFICSTAVFLHLIHRVLHRKGSNNLRGPPAPSKLLGNEYQILQQTEIGSLDFKWTRDYGATWRTHGYYGVEQVMTADPKALQHILHKSGYKYPKRMDQNHMTYLFLGPGIIWAEGDIHSRHRKVMNPAFTAQQLRTFIPLFQSTAQKVIRHWKDAITEAKSGDRTGDIILVNQLLTRASLDIIGEAAFDYQFGAVDNQESPLAKEYNTIFTDIALYPSKASMLYRATFPYLPPFVLSLTKYAPTRIFRRFRALNKMFASIGHSLIQSTIDDGATREGKRDVLSVLAKANANENGRLRLDDEEVIAQMHHLTAAGHETTANTLTWMLYELAKLPAYQTRIREEIRTIRAEVVARSDEEFVLDDLDNMKYLLAAIKETLRFHPILFHIFRCAAEDDVIPLSEPVIGENGEIISEVSVSAGQNVTISICGYNRLPSVWGRDADTWNPERFFTDDTEKQVKVGVYANLMSFSAGIRSCIGWRFALNQLQAVAAALLENFVFSLPEDKPHILRVPAGVMVPLVEGKEEMGTAMPLHVSLAK